MCSMNRWSCTVPHTKGTVSFRYNHITMVALWQKARSLPNCNQIVIKYAEVLNEVITRICHGTLRLLAFATARSIYRAEVASQGSAAPHSSPTSHFSYRAAPSCHDGAASQEETKGTAVGEQKSRPVPARSCPPDDPAEQLGMARTGTGHPMILAARFSSLQTGVHAAAWPAPGWPACDQPVVTEDGGAEHVECNAKGGPRLNCFMLSDRFAFDEMLKFGYILIT